MDRISARRRRWELRHKARGAGCDRAKAGRVTPKSWWRLVGCGRPVGDVELWRKGDTIYPTNVATCGSAWVCAVCASKINRHRATEVEAICAWHRANGGSTALLTLTLRHSYSDNLRELATGVCRAFRRLQQRELWRYQVRPGLSGFVRSLEVTIGDNGFHPHLHVLLLVDGDLSATLHLETEISIDWAELVVDELGEAHRPQGSIGCDLRKIGSGEYVTKVAAEVTRSDVKSSGRSPWSLIDRGEWDRWAAYCEGTRGLRSVYFSRGLRAAAGLNRELTDEEAASIDAGGELVTTIEARRWFRHWRNGRALHLIEFYELRESELRKLPALPALPLIA